ncbi:unnamed protein product [Plutella xylostella]|uniref:(diamondback moth) hypothetical protein n=1 Tax=Plutella xylostella TaxID=51655 RepID=A0A8S4FVP8_PLUXY|nr:unnamed protein product [Plutella xylostella]
MIWLCYRGIITSYTTRERLANYSVRVGSSYNGKGGSIYNIKQITNNFDMKVSVIKLAAPLEFSTRVAAIKLPSPEDLEVLGDLAQMIAWTPNGHIRVVNAPVISPALCESHTAYPPGHYVCLGGVQDPNRHFCRRDNGGAVVQNNQLIGITTFIMPCAHYTKTHAFPKISMLSSWLETIIWDEENRTTTETTQKPTTAQITLTPNATTEGPVETIGWSGYTLPFDPINVPLEPAEDNSVIPRMSVYESYLHSMVQSKKTSTSSSAPPMHHTPQSRQRQRAWLQKVNEALMMRPRPNYAAREVDLDYDYE